MTKIEQLKKQLKRVKEKEMNDSLADWQEGYIAGLKRAIEIMEG